MRKLMPAVIAASLLITSIATAQEATQAGATAARADAQVGTAIENRAVVGAAESFPAGTEKLYCQSKVSNVAADSEIEHVWYKGDQEVARVKLRIGGSPWRTHSSKTLGADGNGDWRCDVVQDGKVLQSVKVKVGA
jgi:hypothetical protein